MGNLKLEGGFLSFMQRTGAKNLIPDKMYLQLKYKRDYGTCLNLKKPIRFNEKMQWLKLYIESP